MLLLFSVFEETHCIFNPAMDPGDDSLIDELDDELESTLQQVDRRALEGIDPSATDAAQLTVVQPLVQVCPARLSSFLSCVVCRSTPKGGGLTGSRPRRSGWRGSNVFGKWLMQLALRVLQGEDEGTAAQMPNMCSLLMFVC